MMKALPSPEDLQCFAEVARLSSFSGAAHSLALSPGAVSQRIRNLEDQLGVELFRRTTRTCALTRAGHAFRTHALRTLEAAEEAVRASRGEVEPPPLELVLGTRHELGMSWIVPMLPSLGKELPSLTFHLYFGSGADLLHRVRSLVVDCAVTSSRLSDPKLDARVLHEERYVFVGAPRLLSERPLSRPADCRAHTLLDTTEELPLYRYLRDAPGGVGDLGFGAVRRMGAIAAIRALVLAAEGVAVLPEYYVKQDIQRRRLRRLFPKAPVLSDQFRLVFRADDTRVSYFEAVASHMRARPLR